MQLTIVGCGFLGSLYTEELCKRLFAGERNPRLVFIDNDKWERRNAANQGVRLADAERGTSKASTMCAIAEDYGLKAHAIADRVSEDNISELLEGTVMLVDAVDNLATRQLLWTWAFAHEVPTLHLGLSPTGCGSVQWSAPGHDTFSLSPLRTAGKVISDPASGMEPPCKLAAMRGAGWLTAFAGAMATAQFLGFDPEGYVADVIHEQGPFISPGYLTDWKVTPEALTPLREVWSWLGQL